jgi:translation initiation factor IF-2
LAKQKRVHEIAKELGVSSKAIIAKCEAEGVPGITTHMSPVKLGLVQTIHEWFSDARNSTAVEVAEKVDLSKARKSARRRKSTADGGEDDHADHTDEHDEGGIAIAEPEGHEEHVEEAGPVAAEAPPAVHEPTTAAPSAAPQAAPAPEQVETAPTITAPAESAAPAPHAAAPVSGQPTVQAPSAASAPAPETAAAASAAKAPHGKAPVAKAPAPPSPRSASVQPMGRPNVPDRPKIVKPMGHQLDKPKQVQLRGPKVVRIEQPDVLEAPRPRRGPGGGGGPGGAERDESDGPAIARSRGPARGRGVGGGAAPSEGDAGRGGAANRRGGMNTRRGRSADALLTGPTKFTEADLAELDARLNRATGFLKQRRRDLKKREGGVGQAMTPAVTGGKVIIAEPVTIKELSSATGIKSSDIIKYLFKKGVMATINSAIDTEAAMEIALEYDIELEVTEKQTAEQLVVAEFEHREPIDMRRRPPVVTVLGHVDHGKTSLLDRIRSADVAAHEAGGITQHVGAYRVTIQGAEGQEKTVVFLDTPGHEAFTSMRARGAKMTDLVVLVVAADDGVMPQTIESINHAKAAGVPIVVALNKIDKAEATEGNIRKIYGQLAEHGLNPVEWGGDTEVMKVSATQGAGVTDLLEVLDYQAELKELQADYGGAARGVVIESEMQEGRGAVARVLVQQGQIKLGDFIVIGRAYGRVRDMIDDRMQSLKEAGPATPLEISGIDSVPDAGDKFYVTNSFQKAEEIATQFREREREKQLATKNKVTLDNFAEQLAAGQTKDLRVVLKADVQGSIDVLRKSLEQLGNTEVAVRVLHAAVGGITESDVLLADASDAVIIGFHVVAPAAVREIADQREVDIRLYRIIYECTDDVKKALEGMLSPEMKEERLGEAEVREVFRITKVGAVAGCLVTEGVISRNAKVRVVRDNVIVTDNRGIESLRRVKEDVKEVRLGTECGIRMAGFDDLKNGDKIVAYKSVTVKRTLG